jgi:hypothetical protein
VAAAVLKQYYRRQQAAEARQDGGHWAQVCKDGPPKWKDHEGMTRAEQRILAQFRAGKCSLLNDYRHLCGWAENPACECGAPVQDVEHVLLQCPIHVPARNRLFEPPMKFGVEVLARFPERAARFLRDTGRSSFKATRAERSGRPRALPAAAQPCSVGAARGWATRKAAGAAGPARQGKAPLKTGEAFRAARAERAQAAGEQRPEGAKAKGRTRAAAAAAGHAAGTKGRPAAARGLGNAQKKDKRQAEGTAGGGEPKPSAAPSGGPAPRAGGCTDAHRTGAERTRPSGGAQGGDAGGSHA